VLLIITLLWGSVSTVQIIRSALAESGGNDLYTYWYAGLHIRQGTDPYRAFLDGVDPNLPIRFLDGEVADKRQIIRPELQPAPGLTFPLIFLLTPFAWFSFQTAKIGWFILLMLMNLLIPGLLFLALFKRKYIPKLSYLVMLAIFMGFSSTRYASISGQPSILVIALMLLAWIWAKDRPYLAGILLGIALSKYSLALGFWTYFTFFEWRPRLSLTTAGVQIVGLVGLAGLGDISILQAIDGYIQLFLHHAPMEGIQLTSLLPEISAYSPPLAIGLTLITGIPLLALRRRIALDTVPLESQLILRSSLLTVLTFWSLMVAYHRAYDLQVFIIALGSALLIWQDTNQKQMSKGIVLVCGLYVAFSILILSLPAGGLLRTWLPVELGPIWIRVVLRASTWVIMIGMGLTIPLLFRLTAQRKPG
jgi:hypothetical protein